MRADRGELFLDPRGAAFGFGASTGRNAIEQVLGDRKVVENRGVLIDDADAQRLRQSGRGLGERLPTDFDGAGIPGERARGYCHERRFSGAILADQRVDFTLGNIQADPTKRDHAGKSLDDVR